MVAPITYPPRRIEVFPVNAAGSYKVDQVQRARQRRPYNLQLPYRVHRFNTWEYGYTGDHPQPVGPIANWGNSYEPWQRRAFPTDTSTAEYQVLSTRLANKLNSDIRSTAALGVSIVEGRQAMTMIAGRLKQIGLFARALKRLDFTAAAWILKSPGRQAPSPRDLEKLRLPPGLRARRGSRAFAANFLEFHFGWDPLITDIQDALTVLDAPIPLGRHSVKAGFPDTWYYNERASDWTFKRVANTTHKVLFYGKAGVEVEVTNPNQYLASSMGLTTPLSLAWEVIPFSFVVDWFFNVGNYLDSFEVGHPFTYRNPWHTFSSRVTTESSGYYNYFDRRIWAYRCVTGARSTQRLTSLPGVYLHRKRVPLFEDKLRRAIAACSLLTQVFIRYR